MRFSPGLITLSPGEIQLLRLLCLDNTNKEIAFVCHVGEGTVKRRLYDMMFCLDVHSRAGMVSWAWLHPTAFTGASVDPEMHPANCSCTRSFCVTLYVAPQLPVARV